MGNSASGSPSTDNAGLLTGRRSGPSARRFWARAAMLALLVGFVVPAAPAAAVSLTLSFSAQPAAGGAAAGTVWANQPVVGFSSSANASGTVTLTLRDSVGNAISISTAQLSDANGACANNACTHSFGSGANGVSLAGLKVDKAGTYKLAASAADGGTDTFTGATSSSFTLTAVGGTPSKLVFTVQPGGVTAGQAVSPRAVVALEDSSGNIVVDSTHVVVVSLNASQCCPSWSIQSPPAPYEGGSGGTAPAPGGSGGGSGGATPAPAQPCCGGGSVPYSTVIQTITLTNGVTTVPWDLYIYTAGAYTLTAATIDSGGKSIATVASSSFTISVGPAASLSFMNFPTYTYPVGATAGAAGRPLTPQPVVALRDGYGNTVTADSTHHGTVSLAGGPGGSTLSGTTTLTLSQGLATFTDLSIDTPGSYILVATTDAKDVNGNSIGSAQSQTFYVSDRGLVFTTQPGGAVAGQLLSPQPVVKLVDFHGNTVADSTHTVNVYPSSPGSCCGGVNYRGNTLVTLSNGVATFTDLEILAAGTFTLFASTNATDGNGNGLTNVESHSFTITAGAAPAKLVFTNDPQTITLNVLRCCIGLALQDTSGNAVNATSNVTVSLSSSSVGGSFRECCGGNVAITSVTIGAGNSRVGFEYIDSVLGSPAITATAAALGLTATQVETIVPVPPPNAPFITGLSWTPAFIVDNVKLTGTTPKSGTSSSVISYAGTTATVSWQTFCCPPEGVTVTSFDVERQLAGEDSFKTVGTALPTFATSFADILPDTAPLGFVQYRVCAVGPSGRGCGSSRGGALSPPSVRGAQLTAALTSNLSLTSQLISGTGSAVLSWAQLNQGHAGFSVSRFDPAAEDWQPIAFTGPDAVSYPDVAAGSFPIGALNYRLCALNVLGTSCTSTFLGRPSAPATLTATLDNRVLTVGTALTGASTVSAINSTQVSHSGTVTLGWHSLSSSQSGFSVSRWDPIKEAWVPIQLLPDPNPTTGLPVTGTTDTPPAGSAQAYLVCAINAVGKSCSSASVTPPPLPRAFASSATLTTTSLTNGGSAVSPTSPTAVAVAGNVVYTATVTLNWDLLDSNHDGFRIQRWDPVNQTWAVIAYAGPNAISYPDSAAGTLAPDALRYRVCALNLLGARCFFPFVRFPGQPALSASVDNGAAQVDASLTSTAASLAQRVTGTKVSLSWTASGTDQAGFKVSRWDPIGQKWVLIAVGGHDAISYVDTTPNILGFSQPYLVCAFNLQGSNCASVVAIRPSAPSVLTPARNGTQVTLTWLALASNQKAFAVYRWNATLSQWALIKIELSATATSYTDTAAGTGPTYYYLAAFNQFGAINSGLITAPATP